MTNRLKMFFSMLLEFGTGFVLIGLMLFCSAGTISYWNGWAFITALGIPMSIFGTCLFLKEPEILKRRLKSKEPDKSQRINIAASGFMFLFSFVLAGIDFRFGWSKIPFVVIVLALMIMLLGYCMFVMVIIQNAYASRTVEIIDGQKIITSGLYSLIRHPMYTASILIFLTIPLILGSYYALIPMLFYPVIIVRRIKNEEVLLINQLGGYKEYIEKVRYRLLPFIW